MPTSTLLSNPLVTINAVDLTDQCTSANITVPSFNALAANAFGDTGDKFVAGLQNNEWSFDFYWSVAASETYATLAGLVGTTTVITVKATSAAVSVTNPLHTLSGTFLPNLSPSFAQGELSVVSVTFQGGTVVTTTS